MLGSLGKKTDGIADAVEMMAMTMSIHGTFVTVGASNGTMMGATAIPKDKAVQ